MSKKSDTEQLASDIEMLTGSCWGREQRHEICDLIRKYRFGQISAVLAKVSKLVHETGELELSEKIAVGKF